VHAPTEDRSDDTKDSFNEELKYVLNKFPKYHMKITFEEIKAKAGDRIFSNQQSVGRVYMGLVTIMGPLSGGCGS
jgi:hypothetical protein